MRRLLSKSEAAAYCSLSPSGFQNWIDTGKMPPPLYGTKRWDRNQIDQAIEKLGGAKQDSETKTPADYFDAWESGQCA